MAEATQELPFHIELNGPEEDGSWGIDVRLVDGRRLLTAGATIPDAIRNALESWPDEMAALDPAYAARLRAVPS